LFATKFFKIPCIFGSHFFRLCWTCAFCVVLPNVV